MDILDIILRLVLTVVLSGLIGFEREISKSNAGLRTHILVGVGATTIALIQLAIVEFTHNFNISVSTLHGATEFIRTDPSRIIAQVVSGIGFLGAGSIIVTKRNVSGLTTAASIWNVAAIGIALGMGFYLIAICSFTVIFITLISIKKFASHIGTERVVIKYLGGETTLLNLERIFDDLNLIVKPLKYSVAPFKNEYVYTNIFEIENSQTFNFTKLVNKISRLDKIISIERTNIE